MTDTDKILEALAYDLKEGKLKSKQRAFVKHHESLLLVREYLSLQQISEALRSKHGIDLKPQVISNMMTRVRQKTGKAKQAGTDRPNSEEVALRKNTNKGIFGNVSGKPKSVGELHNPEADLKKFEDKYK